LMELLMKKHVAIESVSINYKYENEVNPCGESDQLVVILNFAKHGFSEAKLKARYLKYFDAKLRFMLLASLSNV